MKKKRLLGACYCLMHRVISVYQGKSWESKGVFTWHRGDFRASASSLRFPFDSWLCNCLHDTNPRCHAGRVTPAQVHPGCCTGARISLQYEISHRHHVNAKPPTVSAWYRSAGGLEGVEHALCLRFWIERVFYQHEVYLQITEIWNEPSSCKHGTKSKSHPGMKLAPVRVFSCKHPLRLERGSAFTFTPDLELIASIIFTHVGNRP